MSQSAPSKQPGEAPDDHALVARARLGDAAAWAAIIDSCGPRIYAMLTHLCAGDREQAAECTQEAFARAWERLAQFDGRSQLATWIWRLARNRAIDLLARKRPQAADLVALAPIATTPAPDAASERADIQRYVHAALAKLDPEQREVLMLREFEGLDYAEIALATGVAEGTVKSRLSRARSALHDLLAPMLAAEDRS
jgi:RNA polymerase sigma-70 factor (ECF subfamily)